MIISGSSGFVSLIQLDTFVSGRFVEHTLKKASASEVKQAQVTDVVAVLQQLPEQEHKLQFIAVGEHGMCEWHQRITVKDTPLCFQVVH